MRKFIKLHRDSMQEWINVDMIKGFRWAKPLSNEGNEYGWNSEVFFINDNPKIPQQKDSLMFNETPDEIMELIKDL